MSLTRLSVCSLLLLVGCAGSQPPASEPTPDGPSASTSPRYDADVITRAEVDQSSLGELDAMTIIKRLRPQFLAFRGNTSTSQPGAGVVQVMIDNGPLTGVDVLTSVRGSEIQDIRYLNVAGAAQRFGSRSKAAPVILLRRR